MRVAAIALAASLVACSTATSSAPARSPSAPSLAAPSPSPPPVVDASATQPPPRPLATATASQPAPPTSPAPATAPQPSGPRPVATAGLDRTTLQLTRGFCTGTDKPKLSVSPMRPEDFGIIVPYGLVVTNHVTPIDHQYFQPRDPASALDAYEVRAMADATVSLIQARRYPTGPKTVEYRIHFAMSCKLIYYYDLVTFLSPRLQAALDSGQFGLQVKAGEVIGRIGGQTLDFALWDLDVRLPGFVVPEHYAYEPWKIHTVDPLPYYTDELRAFITSRYVRTAEPISGRLDHDRDGRLVGNWFQVGTNGYQGLAQATYWRGHLSIAPNHWDPTRSIVSLGDLDGVEAQFAIRGERPPPADVSVATGLVRYDLVGWHYLRPDGAPWDRRSQISGPRLAETGPVRACLLVQLIEPRSLRVQAFNGRSCEGIAGFDGRARLYER